MGFSESDQELLRFAAEHRFLLRQHVQALLGIPAAEARRQLRRLSEAGALRSAPQPGGAEWFLITRAGLRAIASRLPLPRERASTAAHDSGLAWIHLAARAGAFGRCRAIVSEREMRSHDRREDRGERYGVRRGGVGRYGEDRLHYPDLLLVDRGGRRIAVELELTGKSRAAREEIFFAYAAAPNVDVVLYLVQTPAMAGVIRRAARDFGISDRVHVQYVRAPSTAPPAAGGRSAGRAPREVHSRSRPRGSDRARGGTEISR